MNSPTPLPGLPQAALLAGVLLLSVPQQAQANITCIASVNSFWFTQVIPWRSTPPMESEVFIRCSNSLPSFRLVAVCLSLGVGSGGGDFTNRRLASEAAPLKHAIPARVLTSGEQNFGSFYDSQTSPQVVMSLVGIGSKSVTVPIKVRLPLTNATLPPGKYRTDFKAGSADIATATTLVPGVNISCLGNNPDITNNFSFSINAEIKDFCEISAQPSDMRFPDVDGVTDIRKFASTDITLRCTNSTPYRIGLQPSNGDLTGQGIMRPLRPVADPSETVPYALFRDSTASLQPWGNQPDNQWTDRGTGLPQTVTVFGAVPAGVDATPGTYQDKVIVTVTY